MPFRVEKCVVEDVDRLVDITFDAFREDVWGRIMFPTAPPAGADTPTVSTCLSLSLQFHQSASRMNDADSAPHPEKPIPQIDNIGAERSCHESG